jgi:hypothetical protein
VTLRNIDRFEKKKFGVKRFVYLAGVDEEQMVKRGERLKKIGYAVKRGNGGVVHFQRLNGLK